MATYRIGTDSKGNQTITFPTILDKVITDAAFYLNATNSSSLPITYSTNDTGIISLSGNLVILKSIGTATITASQTGNEFYNPATQISNTFQITQLPLVSKYTTDLKISKDSLVNNLDYEIQITGSLSITKIFDINNYQPFNIGLEKDYAYGINVKSDEHFEVGRAKNGQSKIDYASTIENAYDELNKILGSDGIKSLTDDTQRLMKQQMQLAESMQTLSPLVEKMMPMAQQMQGMMEGMNGNGGMSKLMDMAKQMATGLGSVKKTS